LHVVLPETLIATAVDMGVDSIAVGLIVLKFSFINITLCVPESALSMSFVVLPEPLVLSPIGPYLNSEAVTVFTVGDLAFINRSIWVLTFFCVLKLGVLDTELHELSFRHVGNYKGVRR
jgi:hypothetical protein